MGIVLVVFVIAMMAIMAQIALKPYALLDSIMILRIIAVIIPVLRAIILINFQVVASNARHHALNV